MIISKQWVLLLVVGIGPWFSLPGLAAGQADADSNWWGDRLAIVLLDLENKTGDAAAGHWRGVSDAIGNELEFVKTLRVLPDEALDYGLWRIQKKRGAIISVTEARKLGEVLEARRVVLGEYRRQGEKWEASVRVLNIATGKTSGELTASAADWFEIRDSLVQQILKELQVVPRAAERAKMFGRGTRSPAALEWLMKARNAYRDKKPLPEVEAYVRKALAADPKYASAYSNLGAILGSQGKLDEGLEAVRQGLQLEADAGAHHLLGTVLLFQGKLSEAEDEFRTALRQDPDDANSCERLGELYDKQDWTPRAMLHFKKAVALNPFQVSARAHLAMLYVQQQKREQAVAELKEAEHFSSPRHSNAEQKMAQAYAALHEIPSALEHYEKFLQNARELGQVPELVQQFEKDYQALRATLHVTYVTAPQPKIYSEQELLAAVRQKLTPQEMRLVSNPMACTPEMKRWAEELTREGTNSFHKAKLLFERLSRRLDAGGGGTRTAQEVFAAWNQTGASFRCQEYARLYVALARAVGVPAFFTYVLQTYDSNYVTHACAAVEQKDKYVLVDPSLLWFGVPHKKFVIWDDWLALAGYLSQLESLPHRRLAAKLQPDLAIAQFNVVFHLINEGKWEEARRAAQIALPLDPESWMAQGVKARFAWHEKKTDEAITLLTQTIEKYPAEAQLRIGLVNFYLDQDKLREARAHLRAALHLGISEDQAEWARRKIAQINEKIGSE